MKKALAGILIIGVFAVAAFGLWLMACGDGQSPQFCDTISMLCGRQICPTRADGFAISAFHLEMFMNLLLAVFLAGFAALATLMFFDLFWRPRAGTEFNFAAVSVYVSSSHQRHLRWFALHEKRDPAPIN